MTQIPMKDYIPDIELTNSGNVACPGCGASLSMKLALKAMGPKTVVVIPACCWSIIAGPYPLTSLKIPIFHTAFETAAVAATGIKSALEIRGEMETAVLAWAGDGGTFDIGFQSLSGAAERNDDIIYVCYDNEAYMNTGIQRSSATPWGTWTTTTPTTTPKTEPKKKIMDIMAAHRIPYAATATLGYPIDLIGKVKKARSIKGMKFLHLLSPCPAGWKSRDDQTVELTRLAVRSRVFPLFEVENGFTYTISRECLEGEKIPVVEYVKRQGRFRHLSDGELAKIQESVDREWKLLLKKVEDSKTVEIPET